MTFLILRYLNASYYSQISQLHCYLEMYTHSILTVSDAIAVSMTFREADSNYGIQFAPARTPSSLDAEVAIGFSPVLVSRPSVPLELRSHLLFLHQSLFEHRFE